MSNLLTILTGQDGVTRNLAGYVFDTVLIEEHTSELEVTDSPVETGESISDHAYMKPLKLRIVAGVSDVVLNPLQRFVGADPYGAGKSRSITAFELLQELQAAAEPFDVQTGLKLYSNMVITSLNVMQDKDSAKALWFECSLREVIIVDTQTVAYSKSPQARPVVKRGEQQAIEVDDEAKKEKLRQSLSAYLGDKAVGAAKSYLGIK